MIDNPLVIFASLLLAFTVSGKPAPRTVVYKYPWGQDSVTYDANRYSTRQIDDWMRLSPYLSANNNLRIPIGIVLCIEEEKGYVDCKSKRGLNMSNVRINIHKVEAIRQSLVSMKEPADLQPVVAYLLKIQDQALSLMLRERDYLLTRTTEPLTRKENGIAPPAVCSDLMPRIENAKDPLVQEKLVTSEWDACVHNANLPGIGPYPEKAWQVFLKSHHIVEINTDTAADF